MNAPDLLASLHGHLLRALSLAAKVHFRGLAQASRCKALGPSSGHRKQLLRLDATFNLNRHATQISCDRCFDSIMADCGQSENEAKGTDANADTSADLGRHSSTNARAKDSPDIMLEDKGMTHTLNPVGDDIIDNVHVEDRGLTNTLVVGSNDTIGSAPLERKGMANTLNTVVNARVACLGAGSNARGTSIDVSPNARDASIDASVCSRGGGMGACSNACDACFDARSHAMDARIDAGPNVRDASTDISSSVRDASVDASVYARDVGLDPIDRGMPSADEVQLLTDEAYNAYLKIAVPEIGENPYFEDPVMDFGMTYEDLRIDDEDLAKRRVTA